MTLTDYIGVLQMYWNEHPEHRQLPVYVSNGFVTTDTVVPITRGPHIIEIRKPRVTPKQILRLI